MKTNSRESMVVASETGILAIRRGPWKYIEGKFPDEISTEKNPISNDPQAKPQLKAGTTVCQMFGNTVGAYLNSADLSVNGLDENGNPLPGGDDYKHGFFPEYHFCPQKLSNKDKPIYLWHTAAWKCRWKCKYQLLNARKKNEAFHTPIFFCCSLIQRLI